MKKGERLEINVSVLATRDLDDDEALRLATRAVQSARMMLLVPSDGALEVGDLKRFTSGISVGPVKRVHRHHPVVRRRWPLRGRA